MKSDLSSAEFSELLRRLRKCDSQAFGELYVRLMPKLIAFASFRARRQPELTPIYDGRDAFQSGMNAMWMSIMAGKMPAPDSVDDFLRIARTFIKRRINAKVRELKATKRTGRFATFVPDDLDVFAGDLPLPDAVAIADDEYHWFLGILRDEFRELAELRIKGHSVVEIAELRGKPLRTIQRMFHEIRLIWEDSMERRELNELRALGLDRE
jgi:DNA-directed RNA polymerase specialized sigma24 family protein